MVLDRALFRGGWTARSFVLAGMLAVAGGAPVGAATTGFSAQGTVTVTITVEGDRARDVGVADSSVQLRQAGQPGLRTSPDYPSPETVRVVADDTGIDRTTVPPPTLAAVAEAEGGLARQIFRSQDGETDLTAPVPGVNAEFGDAQATTTATAGGQGTTLVLTATASGEASDPGAFVSASSEWTVAITLTNLSEETVTVVWAVDTLLSANVTGQDPERGFSATDAIVFVPDEDPSTPEAPGTGAASVPILPGWYANMLLPPDLRDDPENLRTFDESSSTRNWSRTYRLEIPAGESATIEVGLRTAGSASTTVIPIPLPASLPLLVVALATVGVLGKVGTGRCRAHRIAAVQFPAQRDPSDGA